MTLQLPQDAGRLVRRQAGVITRAQAMAAGLTRHAVYARLASGRWQRLHAGVYAAYSGPLARESQLWAAVLGARPGAVLCHQTAAELHGLLEPRKGGVIHVMARRGSTVAPMTGVAVHYSRRVDAARHPALQPPRTRLEETVLDLAETERTATGATAWILDACASRRITPARLLEVMDGRTLRYSYADVTERPCEVADEVARALASRGYTGGARRCGDSCAPGAAAVLARAG